MQYYRCKCGKSTAMGSMGPYPCQGCKECGTTLAQHPDDHRKPEPHKWIETKVETDDGGKILTRCQWCLRTRAQIEDEEETHHFFLDANRFGLTCPIIGAHVRTKLSAERVNYGLYHNAKDGFADLAKEIMDGDPIPSGSKIIALPRAHR